MLDVNIVKGEAFMSVRKFNEDTRVKIPATLHFMKIGYDYQALS